MKDYSEPLEDIFEILHTAGTWAYGKDIYAVAQEWTDHDFEPQQIHDWINVGFCPYAQHARTLQQNGITPDLANLDPDTLRPATKRDKSIGYRFAFQTLSLEDALKATADLRAKQNW